MHIVLEEIEGNVYGDIILSPHEASQMRLGEMISRPCFFQNQIFYFGVRMEGKSCEEFSFEDCDAD